MDDIDLAQAAEQRLRDAALAEAIAKAQPKGTGADDCVICRNPIPPARRLAAPHALTCVDCQAELEQNLGR